MMKSHFCHDIKNLNYEIISHYMKRVTIPNPQQTFRHMAYLNFNI